MRLPQPPLFQKTRSNKNIKRVLGFTLIELIVVIAIISILASIILIIINPAIIFANARNATRSSDISNIQSAINKYIAESPINALSRNLKDLSGYASLYASATAATPQGNCPGGSNGTGLATVVNPYSLDSTSSNQYSILLTPLINGGYISKVPQDPLTNTSYLSCIDTINSNQLIIYAKSAENNAAIPTLSLGTYNPSVLVWDSFNRADTVSTIGTADSGQTWSTINSSSGYANILTNQLQQYQPGSNTSLIDSGSGNGDLKVTLINNVAGNYGIVFRVSNSNTYWYFGHNGGYQIQLYKYVNGTQVFAQGTGFSDQNIANNATIEVIYSGQAIIGKYNGAIILNYTDPAPGFNLTSTQVGLYTLGLNDWDNFTVTKP